MWELETFLSQDTVKLFAIASNSLRGVSAIHEGYAPADIFPKATIARVTFLSRTVHLHVRSTLTSMRLPILVLLIELTTYESAIHNLVPCGHTRYWLSLLTQHVLRLQIFLIEFK